MVNEEIVGGLRSALERGYSLEKAMLTLFNAGYKRKEIEEAAINLLQFQQADVQQQTKPLLTPEQIKSLPQTGSAPTGVAQEERGPVPSMSTVQKSMTTFMQKPVMQQPFQPPFQLQRQLAMQKPVQKISSYEAQGGVDTQREKVIIIILVCLLAFLLLALGAIFVFRQNLIEFLNRLLG